MLGLRGCRLGNLYPEITEMQTRAIMEAAIELKKEGVEAFPEIMVPLTGIVFEFKAQKDIIEKKPFNRCSLKITTLWTIRSGQ